MPRHDLRRRRRGRRRQREEGTGLVGTVAGVAVFLVLLLVAVQLLFNLYATSTVTSVGYDAARQVASDRVDHANPGAVGDAEARVERRARQQLGRYGRRVSFSWAGTDAATVRLRIQATHPRVGFGQFIARPLGFDTIDRTIVVRAEQFR